MAVPLPGCERAIGAAIVAPFYFGLGGGHAQLNGLGDLLGNRFRAGTAQTPGQHDARISQDAVAVLVGRLDNELIDRLAGLLQHLHEIGLNLSADFFVGRIGDDAWSIASGNGVVGSFDQNDARH
jgi:hypothetical protein